MKTKDKNMNQTIEELTQVADTWPLDVRKLSKGDNLTVAQVEEITGTAAGSSRFPFAVMGLRAYIMQETARTGSPLSVSIRNGGLHVNTDAEASQYHHRLARDGERSIHRNFQHLCRTVSVAKLSDHERADHERHQRVWALKIAAMKKAGGPNLAHEAQVEP